MTPEEMQAARRSVQLLKSPTLEAAEPQGQILMSVQELRNDLERTTKMLDHIDALEARIAAVLGVLSGPPTAMPEPEGRYFPSYRDASYKVADYPPKVRDSEPVPWPKGGPDFEGGVGALCDAPMISGKYQGIRCKFGQGHAGTHSWED